MYEYKIDFLNEAGVLVTGFYFAMSAFDAEVQAFNDPDVMVLMSQAELVSDV